MAIFCTKCGAKNDDGAAFCEGCGVALRQPATLINTPPPAPKESTTFVTSKKMLYAGVALVGLLLVGGSALYLGMRPPAADGTSLLAAAKAGYGKTLSGPYKNELCLSNMDYSLTEFNVAEHNQSTQAWLNTLVSAGLYNPAVPISSGGYFAQTLLQYVATPELAKWREGSRLCLAKEVEIADVVEIGQPQQEALGRPGPGNTSKVLMVKAKLVLQSNGTAPWLEKSEIQTAVLEKLGGWEYKNAQLQKQTPDVFGLQEGRWTTGPTSKAAMQQQYQASQRANAGEETARNTGNQGFLAGLGAQLSHLFGAASHPLAGKWRMDTEAMGNSLGMGLPSGLGLNVTMSFTSDSLEMGGESIKCTFEVDGKRVKVTPEGQIASLIFVMQDHDSASIDMGIFKVKYKRVN